VDVSDAAERWARVWEAGWQAADVAAIAALYAPDASYRSHPHRPPEDGGAAGFTRRTFATESAVRCRFARPIAQGDRAAVEWWAVLVDDGAPITLTGTTVLTFDADGLVVAHVDYWVQADGTVEPFPGWGGG
jgi:ketosteroid isomerase-like protein